MVKRIFAVIVAVLIAIGLAVAAFFLTKTAQAAPKHATGLVLPMGWQNAAPWDSGNDKQLGDVVLPARWDWNEKIKMQPIRDQKGCGSCWDFSTTAVTETLDRALHPATQPPNDLAEQEVLSCSGAGTCNGGYFGAFNYHIKHGVGAESKFPYEAKDLACKAGLTPVAKLTRWAYIGTSGNAPTIGNLKHAIYQRGPIAVSVSADFGNYTGGVYTTCKNSALDHMVVLEGWVDDAAYARNGGGYWIMRNSWGTWWGDAGRMKIAYKSTSGSKCNGIGSVAAYAVMDGVENLRTKLKL